MKRYRIIRGEGYNGDTNGQDAGKISHNDITSRFRLSDVRLRLHIDEDD